MAEPEPTLPDDDKDVALPRPTSARADWLVGADEGLTAEADRVDRGQKFEAPRLLRPNNGEADTRRSDDLGPLTPRPPKPVLGSVAPPAPVPAPATPTWAPGKSSVPRMRRSVPTGPISSGGPIPELARDFPMDDADERARVAAEMADRQALEAAIAARPHEVVGPQEFELPAVPLPWWSRVPELVRMDRRVQVGLLLLALGLAAATFWPRAEKTISVKHLKEHGEQYADTQIRVGGRVSEVFPVGGSWAFTLVQGRDTIVVFSRTRKPAPREQVVVIGTLSRGWFGGESRVAIFEATR